jgi:hypothetical protein
MSQMTSKERIDEIHRVAWKYSINYIGEDIKPQLKRYYEAFAELLIQEASDHIRNFLDYESGHEPCDPAFELGYIEGLRTAAISVKEHFNVQKCIVGKYNWKKDE